MILKSTLLTKTNAENSYSNPNEAMHDKNAKTFD